MTTARGMRHTLAVMTHERREIVATWDGHTLNLSAKEAAR